MYRLLVSLLVFIGALWAVSVIPTCTNPQAGESRVKPGIEVLMSEKLDLIKGKKVGLITNPTGITRSMESTIDVLVRHKEVELTALFGPEHGVRGDFDAGAHIETAFDPRTGIPMYSLYGQTRRPSPEMLQNVEVLIYDIQDIGCRSYTYIYTMAFAMQAAKEAGIPFIVLDRPNPLGGELVEGPMLDLDYRSFIGYYPIAYLYGMTVGELAAFFNREYEIDCDLTVVPMEGWKRSMRFEDTGLPWVPTSPHIPHPLSALYYPTTGIIGELNTFNIGVGYTKPFELLAAPWIDADELAAELNSRNLPGVSFRPIHYRPYYLHFKEELVHGVDIYIIRPDLFKPIATQVHMLTALQKLYPDQPFFETQRHRSFDKAAGSDQLRNLVLEGKSAKEIIDSWQDELQEFEQIRRKYLVYR
ncbi:DUF1343 domain-containing protein [candidate division KSB1 bacterium]|nr:DUF1343 domain-containing protein [candidate division KSB1 bacterium]